MSAVDREAAFDAARRHFVAVAMRLADELEPALLREGHATQYIGGSDLYVADAPELADVDEPPLEEFEAYVDTACAMPIVVAVLAMRGHRASLTWHAPSEDPEDSPVWRGWFTVAIDRDTWDAGRALDQAQDDGGAR